MGRLEIESFPAQKIITVGKYVSTVPDLIRSAEWSYDLKEKICTENGVDHPDGYYAMLPREKNRYFADLLGPKFMLRWQAAHYRMWLADTMSVQTANMLRLPGKSWRFYSDRLAHRANEVLPFINQAERDGLWHIIPAIVVWKQSPQELRASLGKGLWKRIAGHSKTRNMQLMQRTSHGLQHKTDADAGWGDYFVRLMEFPRWSLSFVQSADEAELLTAQYDRSREIDKFWDTLFYVQDTKRMLNGYLNPKWSYEQMLRAHHEAQKELHRKNYSAEPFASDWSHAGKNFTATLLNSELLIADEGAEMHHCVASYAGDAKRRRYAVLKIEGDERATCGLTFDGALWRIQQVYRACNEPVSDKCHLFAVEAAARLTVTSYLQKAA